MSRPRTLTALAVLTLTLAGCGGPGDQPDAEPTWVGATPQPPVTTPGTPSPKASAAPATARSGRTPAKPTGPAARPGRAAASYVFPIPARNASWHKTHSRYAATDIFADCGQPFLAVTKGAVLEVSRRDAYVAGRPDGPLNGGLSVSILGDDGVRYYGSHLSRVQPGITAGARVAAGQRLGLVGRTGNANNVCHLHFGISPKCAGTGDWKVRRGVVWPYSYLASWRAGANKSPVRAVEAWEKSHDCRA